MNTFPNTKIKAQILQNEDIGRVSSKALELIAACSALFVRHLVDHNGDNDNGISSNSSSHQEHETSTNNSRMQTRQQRKASSQLSNNAKANQLLVGDNAPSGPIDLAHVKKQTKQHSEYNDFLDGVLDGLTEKNAPKYDTAARKRKRTRENKPIISKQESFEGLESGGGGGTKSMLLNNLPNDVHTNNGISADNAAAADGGGQDDDAALLEAIQEAQLASAGISKEIIEDDDDYD
mmetsp:Transcript_25368/g.54550  ORF Transcript_25368/g.54550 Transcript_25368/m.54550 type:complete len:235 (+) Transcript_25368:134-838(+)|eukprot:CAMPEP_0172303190 /NCGR_PEP_ID=MMETSP1058-20130122/4767_1 /TAXON_ID=83371 /ORGANISM="Detonula confervacea, Strain CCMP 353" /LENGTH=234 /DNA_ID=CAMNT_0013013923 /DNA_START=61 /DNA_END=765 /DNA_ORIENTATION=+